MVCVSVSFSCAVAALAPRAGSDPELLARAVVDRDSISELHSDGRRSNLAQSENVSGRKRDRSCVQCSKPKQLAVTEKEDLHSRVRIAADAPRGRAASLYR